MLEIIENDVTCTKLVLINLNIKKTIIFSLCNLFKGKLSSLSVTVNN